MVKHCHDSLPAMVSGTLLGLAKNSILEVTYCFPETDDEGLNEMMRMLREVNYDNNCVGWYQSMYLGIYSTSSLLENQFNYQTALSEHAIVLLYDPMQTTHGNLVLKCFRLSDAAIAYKKSSSNAFLPASEIFEEIPLKLSNPGLATALLCDVQHDRTFGNNNNNNNPSPVTFDRLDLSTHPYLEKHLEFLCHWVDDLSEQQQKFVYYKRGQGKNNSENNNSWNSRDAPRRLESLLIGQQMASYCDQMQDFSKASLTKLYMVDSLHKK